MKILWHDVVLVFGFCLAFACGIATDFVLTEVSQYTTAANLLEADPIARLALNLGYSLFVVQATGIAFLVGTYYLLRRNYTRTKSELAYQQLSYYVIAIFLVFMQNFLNDFPKALALVLR